MKKDPHLERNTLIKNDKTNDKEKESNKTFQRKKYITCKKEAESTGFSILVRYTRW